MKKLSLVLSVLAILSFAVVKVSANAFAAKDGISCCEDKDKKDKKKKCCKKDEGKSCCSKDKKQCDKKDGAKTEEGESDSSSNVAPAEEQK